MEEYFVKVSFKSLGNLILVLSEQDGPKITGIRRVRNSLKFKRSSQGEIFETEDLVFLVEVENKSAIKEHPRIFAKGRFCRVDRVEPHDVNGTPMSEEVGILSLSDYLYIVPTDQYGLYDEDEEPEDDDDDDEEEEEEEEEEEGDPDEDD